ncbi:MAG: hypothetical protein WD669_02825 [Pirellulales bacterium]
MRSLFVTTVLLAFLLGQQRAIADVLTDPSQLTAGNTLIDFESFSEGLVSNPLVIGGATFSSTQPLYILDVTGFGADGTEVFHDTLRSSSNPNPSSAGYTNIRIDFAQPVSEIGLGWFDSNFSGNRLEAYNSSNSLLEFAAIPTNPVGGCCADFRAIRRTANEIAYVITNVSSSSDVYSIDNISFGAHGIPEPSSLTLLAICLSVVSISRRFR